MAIQAFDIPDTNLLGTLPATMLVPELKKNLALRQKIKKKFQHLQKISQNLTLRTNLALRQKNQEKVPTLAKISTKPDT